jgi:hypothetical protein
MSERDEKSLQMNLVVIGGERRLLYGRGERQR